MNEVINYTPPTLEEFMSGLTTTVESFRILDGIFNRLEEVPAFLGVSCDAYRPEALKVLQRTLEFEEIALVKDDERKTELEVVFFGLTQSGSSSPSRNAPQAAPSRHDQLHVLKNNRLYREELRDIYSLEMPKQAGEAMAFAFARQNAIVSEMMDGIIGHPYLRALNLKKREFRKGGNSNRVETEDGYVDIKVLGPPMLKLSNLRSTDNVNWLANPVMEADNDRLFPRDELFDINQKRTQNWRGHILFDDGSVTIMKGKLRFWIVGGYLEACFAADSMRKVVQNAYQYQHFHNSHGVL